MHCEHVCCHSPGLWRRSGLSPSRSHTTVQELGPRGRREEEGGGGYKVGEEGGGGYKVGEEGGGRI